MLQGSVMLSSTRILSSEGPEESGKYRDYLKGNYELDNSNTTARANTPTLDGIQRMVNKNKLYETRHAVQVFSKRSNYSKGVKSKNSDIMSGEGTPVGVPSPKQEV